MKIKTIKISLLLSICTLSVLFVGCSLKKEQDPNEQLLIGLEKQIQKEEEVLSNLVLTEEENKVLEKAIQENIENNVNSTQIKNSYFVSSPYSQKVIEVNIDNVIENYSTEGDYGSLWLAVQDENVNKGLFYSFIDGETDLDFIKNVGISFTNTKIIESNVIKVTVPTSKESIVEVYKIEMTDDLGINFYGIAFVMEYTDNNRILCVDISALPETTLDIEKDIIKYSNIIFK